MQRRRLRSRLPDRSVILPLAAVEWSVMPTVPWKSSLLQNKAPLLAKDARSGALTVVTAK